jgi:dTMP kinase
VTREPNLPGWLLVLEGIDGAGKTTQAQLLQHALQARGLPVERTKEPTTGPWGKLLRESATTGRLSLEEEIEAFIKDRQEHVQTTLLPWLRAGKIVILDRYYFSNMAYQGARGYDVDVIRQRNEAFAPIPDQLIILDIDPRLGLQRVHTRGDQANLFENLPSLEKARAIYRAIQAPYSQILDATRPADQTCHFIVKEFQRLYTESIARSNLDPKTQLNRTLALFGGKPL